MVNQFFGFREQPFGATPDPQYLYLGPGHREALASLIYGIESNRGFLTLIAQPGMGKTTLLVHLLEKFRSTARTAFLFQTQCNSREFLRFLLTEFAIESPDNDLVQMHDRFNRYLAEQSLAGKRVIVVIDEAQNLEPSVLETVRLLSNFETPRAKLLQIILAGQLELATKLASPSLSQLRQRIASLNGLSPLSPDEVARFIDHRLKVACYQGPPLFSEESKAMIADLSEGIPRNVNSLCFGALSLACGLQRKTVDPVIVHEVFRDLDLEKLTSITQPAVLQRFSTLNPMARPSQSPIPAPSMAALILLRPAETIATEMSLPETILPEGALLEAALTATEWRDPDERHDDYGVREPEIFQAMMPAPRKRFPRVLLRAAGFAVLIFVVGTGVTKVAAPAIKTAVSRMQPVRESQPLPIKVPTADAPVTVLPPAPTHAEEARTVLLDPGASMKPVNSVSREIRVAVPGGEIAKPSTLEAKLLPAKTNPKPLDNAAATPAELWKRILQGSVSAEVSLATLYIDGSATVKQNCEQADQLLLAAAKAGNPAAIDLLHGKYAEECH